MKHLFIVNPEADRIKGRVKSVIGEIEAFFNDYWQLEYEIHITRWARDASAVARRCVIESDGLVRIHSYGGTGTLFEIISGVAGLRNAQVAGYPYGNNNSFLRYFGGGKEHIFTSLRSQVFSGVTPIDALRCGPDGGGNFGVCYGLAGLEAESSMRGAQIMTRSGIKSDFYYKFSTLLALLKKKRPSKRYEITLDGNSLSGDYITMMIANIPFYGRKMSPASDARPDDGMLDIYLTKDMSRLKFILSMRPYLKGNYKKAVGKIEHYSGKKLKIESKTVMSLAVDGETFYENSIEYEILPYAIDFVLPISLKENPK